MDAMVKEETTEGRIVSRGQSANAGARSKTATEGRNAKPPCMTAQKIAVQDGSATL